MMSRAMATSDQIDYILLAKKGASLDCSLSLDQLPRLQNLEDVKGQESRPVTGHLSFFEDNEHRPWAQGKIQLLLDLPCQRCSERVARKVVVAISVCLVTDENVAQRLASEHDVLVVPKEGLSLAALIEDDLLLSLPSRACEVIDCEFDPLLELQRELQKKLQAAVPGSSKVKEIRLKSDVSQPVMRQDRQRPFEALQELMDGEE